jgi:uncharacterized membrane protein
MFFLSLALAGLFAVTATAADLTIINVSGAVETQIQGLNNQGDIAGAYKDAAGKQHGFLMRKGVFYYPIDAPVAGTTGTQISGINEAGDMVGSYTAPTGTPPKLVEHGFVLRKGQFTSFDVPDSTLTGGYAINTEGDVTGHYRRPVPDGTMRGFLLRNGVFTTFGAADWGLGNLMMCGFGINAERDIVGHFVDGSGQHGFLLTGGVLTPIDHPEDGAATTQALGINSQGEIVGNYKDIHEKVRGFLRSRWGDFTPVDIPDAIATTPRRINARGQIAGTFRDSRNVLRGFVLSR